MLNYFILCILVSSLRFSPCLRASVVQDRPNETWRLAVPGYRFRFPRDHAAHPDYQTEWWYYTGHLRTREGREYGFELTFFRVGIQRPERPPRSAWALRDLYFAHFTITDVGRDRFHVAERVGRGALGMAGARTDRYEVWIDDWQAQLHGGRHHLVARRGSEGSSQSASEGAGEGEAIDLWLRALKPPVIHGKDGIDQKSAGVGRASHYYSLTRLQCEGSLLVDGRRLPVKGLAWMDHEFGSNQLAPDQAGWDWFSLQLDDGRELMLYQLRRKDGSIEPHSNGTLVEPDGTWKHLPLDAFRLETRDRWRSRKSGATYPSGWRVRLPAEGLDLTVTPMTRDQELVTARPPRVVYWEGSVRAEGTNRGRRVSGVGYVELTGYARGGQPRF